MKSIPFYLVCILLLSGTGMGLHALILSDVAVIEATILFVSETYIPDESDVPDILKVSYIAEIEITEIIEGDTTFGCGIIERLKGSRVRINDIRYMNPLLEKTLGEGDDIVCHITYYSKEYHQYGYRTSISLCIFDRIGELDGAEEKKQHILNILNTTVYRYKEEISKHDIKPDHIYITEWKTADFIVALGEQKSFIESKIKEAENSDTIPRLWYVRLDHIRKLLDAVPDGSTDLVLSEVMIPGLPDTYILLVDGENQKVCAGNHLTILF